jgi:hypothetical protein
MKRSQFKAAAGQTMAEYAVVLGVITIATVGAFTGLGNAAAALIEAAVEAVSAIP